MASTATRPADLDTPLWRYALALYRREGVAPACLTLQAHLGLDVCMLIYALYAAHSRCEVSPATVTHVDQGLKAWREQVVLPLRQIRQAMKVGVHEIAPDLNHWVREQIKATEVNAEQVALAYLNTHLASLPQATYAQDKSPDAVQHALRCVLGHFAHMNKHPLETLQMPDVRTAAGLLASEAIGLQQAVNDGLKL